MENGLLLIFGRILQRRYRTERAEQHCHHLAVSDFQIVHRVGLQYVEQRCAALLLTEVRILWKCSMDVAIDDIFLFVHPDRYLQQSPVTRFG